MGNSNNMQEWIRQQDGNAVRETHQKCDIGLGSEDGVSLKERCFGRARRFGDRHLRAVHLPHIVTRLGQAAKGGKGALPVLVDALRVIPHCPT
jgi:hypothetical protein